MKQCVKCKQWKDESEFSWRYEERGILQKACKACRKEENAQWYGRHKEEHRDNVRQRKSDAINTAQRFVYEYLSNKTCMDCGEYDFSVLTFDHVKGKNMDVSAMAAQGYSIDAIKAEIELCEVVCFNCHMRRENERRSGGRFRRFWPKWPWEK